MSISTHDHPLNNGTAPTVRAPGQPAPQQAWDSGSYRQSFASNSVSRDWRLMASAACAAASAIVFLLGWFGISSTSDVYKQLPYLISAGGPGILLIGASLALYLNHEHTADRIGIALVLERLERLEQDGIALGGQVQLLDDLVSGASFEPAPPPRRARASRTTS